MIYGFGDGDGLLFILSNTDNEETKIYLIFSSTSTWRENKHIKSLFFHTDKTYLLMLLKSIKFITGNLNKKIIKFGDDITVLYSVLEN